MLNFDRPFSHKDMPRTEQQLEEIRESRKASIMDAALHLFGEQSIDSVSISMIAKRAGISKGLIYNYFVSKEELIKEIVIRGFDDFTNVFDLNKDGILTEKEFIYFIDQTFFILESKHSFWKLYFAVVMQPKVMKLVEDKLMEVLIPFINTLTNYYERKGVESPAAQARLLGSLLDGVSLNYIVDPEGFSIEETKKIIIEKFI